MWFENAVIYCLDVETFMDGDGDGIGDFRGLTDRLDHLETLGVTCVWLQPFQPSPNLDDGYDVADFYTVDPRLGTLGDFVAFTHALKDRGIRLIIDLVVNHTSAEHPWFKAACADPDSRFRDFYIWSKERPADADQGMVFPGVQETTWTWNEQAQAYYFHRFFCHQPDLNIANPDVRDEILRIMGFWTELGVSGFRVDAAPFLIELTSGEGPQGNALFEFLEEMQTFLSWRRGDAIMLAEANVTADRIGEYFGGGHRMHMLFNFLVNQQLYLALARGEAAPLAKALRDLPPIPRHTQWAQFLRLHDEQDLGRLSDAERREVYAAFGPDPCMQLYDRGIRRRLAPMLGNDPRRILMAHSLSFSLPGAQVIRYGDEIGMGDDLSLKERLAVRTPMQWSNDANGGFSTAPADQLVRPVIGGGPCGYERVNVQAQRLDPNSLLNRIERLIRVRRSCEEIGTGRTTILDTDQPAVLAHRCDGRESVVVLNNLSDRELSVTLALDKDERGRLVEIAGDDPYPEPGEAIDLRAYGFRWFRVDGGDRRP
ncbi:MAG TPA: alpha-amylase family protein [Azospirillum sp.]